MLWNPLTQAERGVTARGKHELAGEGTPAFAPGTGVRRKQMRVQWTVIPSNGLATDGKHRPCKREHGERSVASPLANNRRVGEPYAAFSAATVFSQTSLASPKSNEQLS